MEKVIRGKYLVRKAKLENGTEVLTITGVFHPQNFNLDEINDNDEMWVSDLIVASGGLKFTEPTSFMSPEDFLEGNGQTPREWKNKEQL